MPTAHAGDAGERDEKLRLLEVGDVVDVVATGAATIEAILGGILVMADVEIVIPFSKRLGHLDAALVFLPDRNGHFGDERVFDIAVDDPTEVVNVRERAGNRGEQKHSTVAVLVDKDVVEPARVVGLTNASHLFDRRGVREAGYVENDGAEVGVGSTLAELERLYDVVAVLPLEVLDVHAARAEMKILVLDAPRVDAFGIRWIAQVNDVDALFACRTKVRPADVSVRPVHLLLDIGIGHAEPRSERNV